MHPPAHDMIVHGSLHVVSWSTVMRVLHCTGSRLGYLVQKLRGVPAIRLCGESTGVRSVAVSIPVLAQVYGVS